MTKPRITVIALCLLFAALSAQNVYACTGRPHSTKMKDIDKFDLWVRATVIDRDDRGYNAILRAEEYYKGEGPLFLAVKRHLPALETITGVLGHRNGCLGDGGGHRYRRGASGYVGLKSNGDGTYTDWHVGSALFYVWDGVIPYFEAFEWKEIAEADFAAKLLKLGGRDAPTEPAFADVQRYPLMRYLSITTETGARYQVNPDRSVMPLPEDAPIAVSPNGAYWAHRLDADTLGFGRPYQQQGTPYVSYFTEIPGQEVQFTNDSHLAAVWDSSHLAIYMFSNRAPGTYGPSWDMNQIAVLDLNVAGELQPRVMWSADSTTLAWQDDSGIWRWNLFEEEQPKLVVAEHDCYLIDISERGQYLRYGNARGWTLFDSGSGNRYANTLSAPGEDTLISINNSDETLRYIRHLRHRRYKADCFPPLKWNCALYIDTGVIPVEMNIYPRNLGEFGLLFCEYEGLCNSRLYSGHAALTTRWRYGVFWDNRDMDQVPWRQLAFDPLHDRDATLYGDYHIYLESWHDKYRSDDSARIRQRDYLNLEGIVDSPIASIEWGQPIFYDSFMLTATEYLPRTVTNAGADSS
ncbi:MAG: hypothetical protein OXG53_12455 [Chloroflexi bacterium]|nr:hypothetical protein [Chloroflexota bacterium]